MMLPHPTVEQFSLHTVLSALGDPTRLAIVGDLARREGTALSCSHFSGLGSKSNLSYHIAKMREAGIIRVEPCGTARLVTLRRADLDSRFPGLLDSIISTAVSMPPPEKRLAPVD
ncbi:ArsR/SmtB family transcription factor [Nitratireductor indicus]|uniref:ArsR/SmtB family transcription factor n=1 Tax=Nitratireductor indicus TaxID=721133 RepID=UPI002874CEEB|nr:winged helix-turn-helix domain-containing protein [Nitratireductor indicus]MDS1135823.1 winged helix-turn-helix domain-containing protein [Nitratireductor indicus]